MNELIREYLDLVKRTMKTNDVFAYKKLEQMEHDYPEIADLVYQSAGSMLYDVQQSMVIEDQTMMTLIVFVAVMVSLVAAVVIED